MPSPSTWRPGWISTTPSNGSRPSSCRSMAAARPSRWWPTANIARCCARAKTDGASAAAPPMSLLETMELASYTVTVIGLPLGIGVYVIEQRKERRNEDEEIYQELSDEYMDFLRLGLQHADLK